MPSAEYWAGFFDGEGSVSIGAGYGRLTVSIAQKRREILDMVAMEYGGRVHNKSNVRETGCHAWTLTSAQNATRFLSAIKPYSIVKQQEIEIALDAASETRQNNLGCIPLTLAQREKRMELRGRLIAIRNPRKVEPGATLRDQRRRISVLEAHDYKCGMCGISLMDAKPFDVIIPENIPFCRSCHPKRYAHEFKPVSKEIIENLIAEGKTQNEICSIVGVNRSSLYQKMKKYGIANGYCWPCGKSFQKTAGRQSYCSDECNRVGTATSRLHRAEEYRGKKQGNDRAFYLRHREKRIAKVKEYYEANAERIKAYAREYHRKKKLQGGSHG